MKERHAAGLGVYKSNDVISLQNEGKNVQPRCIG